MKAAYLSPVYDRGPRPGGDQRGAVLLISLIILAVLLAAGAALVRSVDTSLFQAGNLAFRRDLTNQASRVTPIVLGHFQGVGGLLATADARSLNRPQASYSATMLPSNAQGIPNDLLAVTPTAITPITVPGTPDGISVRYLIDRMCLSTGDETTLGDRCIGIDFCPPGGTGPSCPPGLRQVSYRVSIRIDGPRNTQAFFQSTLSL